MNGFLAALLDPNLAFLRNALLAGILSSVLFGVLGSVVTVKRISGLAGAISHAVLGGIIGHRGRVVDVELDVRRNGSRSTVAGGNVQLIAQRRSLERDRDGMLATARTQKQDIHGAVSPQSL